MKVIRRAKGTPRLPVESPFYVCPWCINTGWCERKGYEDGERWARCKCGQPPVEAT